MNRSIIISALLLVSLSVYSQQKKSYIDIARAESQLHSMFEKLYNEEVIGMQLDLFYSIDSLFESVLTVPGSFDYAWKKLDKIGKLSSEDGKMKVFSWFYMVNRDEYHYTCFIQVKNKKNDCKIYRLEPVLAEDKFSENLKQGISNWHGKIYYELITNDHKRNRYYTLLGADFNNSISSIKTIETLQIQRGKPVFTDKLFHDGAGIKNRIVFQYSSELASSVRYNKQLKMIVFDHLVPLHPLYYGNYQFYGPDGSYDGLRFDNGIWVREEDVDARNRQ